jgi:hypothetical protein
MLLQRASVETVVLPLDVFDPFVFHISPRFRSRPVLVTKNKAFFLFHICTLFAAIYLTNPDPSFVGGWHKALPLATLQGRATFQSTSRGLFGPRLSGGAPVLLGYDLFPLCSAISRLGFVNSGSATSHASASSCVISVRRPTFTARKRPVAIS